MFAKFATVFALASVVVAAPVPQLLGSLPIVGPIVGPILDPIVGGLPIVGPILGGSSASGSGSAAGGGLLGSLPIVGPILGDLPIVGGLTVSTGLASLPIPSLPSIATSIDVSIPVALPTGLPLGL